MLKKFQDFITESSLDDKLSHLKDGHGYSSIPELKDDMKSIGRIDKYDIELEHQQKNVFTLNSTKLLSDKQLKEVIDLINSKAKYFTFELQGKMDEFPGDDDRVSTFSQEVVAKAR